MPADEENVHWKKLQTESVSMFTRAHNKYTYTEFKPEQPKSTINLY